MPEHESHIIQDRRKIVPYIRGPRPILPEDRRDPEGFQKVVVSFDQNVQRDMSAAYKRRRR